MVSRRLYYGWVIALALAVSETVSWGIVYYSFSVFLLPMETELGATRAQLSFAFSMALLVSGVAAIPVGRWIDRHGARALMTAGSLLAAGLWYGPGPGPKAWLSFMRSLPVEYPVRLGWTEICLWGSK